MTHLHRPRAAPGVGGVAVIGPILLAASIAWAFWPSLVAMAGRWMHDPRYSHGPLVPLFALAYLWSRRGEFPAPRPNGWGIALIGVGSLVKFAGARYYYEWFDQVALLPVLAGSCLLVGGWPWLRRAWPAIAFLIFMIPLPYRVEYALGGPLQQIATAASTYSLQTLGLPAVADGFIILIDDARIGVVEACNGMGMLFMFFAFATAVALVIRRGPAERAIILLSAIPISLIANVGRITLTGFLHATAGGKVADAFYHDMAGWLMMPLALALLMGELALLSRLILGPAADAGPVPIHPILGAARPRVAAPADPAGPPPA